MRRAYSATASRGQVGTLLTWHARLYARMVSSRSTGCKATTCITCTCAVSVMQPDRQKVMNMITIDAHSRDIVANMVKEGTPDSNSFLWMCQLRSYWDSSISDCRIKICDATFGYGYEYLGNGPRLVITPLTDRIYITATQACWLCMGTAPAGPAGELSPSCFYSFMPVQGLDCNRTLEHACVSDRSDGHSMFVSFRATAAIGHISKIMMLSCRYRQD